MSIPYTRAPHQEGPPKTPGHSAPNAALLIDFDNVTMGMRSDLSNELKNLLNSDIIKGKVAVQRAYADWRRYPQYIVPLSEASIDLIFAPAYGSNKKNATDIRMAIDALELIFIRPEIGTFILLTGDSDFSSLVLKLKEYGKYVIGVGIQESSSDILVQNCDEYYSYTSLAGLRKTTEADTEPVDPWILVEKAVARMEDRNDVMRSDRLKQVMLEIDTGFDESEYGFSKFSRFLTEASSKGLVDLRRLDNGQYEVQSTGKSAGSSPSGGGGGGGGQSRSSGSGGRSDSGGRKDEKSASSRPSSRRTRGRSTRARSGGSGTSSEAVKEKKGRSEPAASPEPGASAAGEDPLEEAYGLLRRALDALTRERDAPVVRDSDVKRKMLTFDSSFDESDLGFSKFSRFLQQADEHDVVELSKRESGNYEVALSGAAPGRPDDSSRSAGREEPKDAPSSTAPEREEEQKAQKEEKKKEEKKEEPARTTSGASGRGLGPRRGERRGPGRKGKSGPPPILEGQVVGASSNDGREAPPTADDGEGASGRESGSPAEEVRTGGSAAGPVLDPDDLGLPTDRSSIIRYMANSYKGVGEKTAEAVVDALGVDLFQVLQTDPERVQDAIPSNRAEQLLDAWGTDFRRRRERLEEAGVELDLSGNGGGTDDETEAPDPERPPADDEPAAVGAAADPGPASESEEKAPAASDDEPRPTRLGRRRRTRG